MELARDFLLLHKKTTLGIAAGLLGVMVLLAVLGVKDDSATTDEVPHIAAGYSYLTAQTYRLNPEHPPLAKDVAALPLLFMDLDFPWEKLAEDENITVSQWRIGSIFLHELGNDADAMLFRSRTAMVVFFLLPLGVLLFYWTRRLLGVAAALFVLLIFSLSPNFLAHGSLVTTDVAAAFGMAFAFYWFLQFLFIPSWKNASATGGALALALLVKFSTFLLLPVFGLVFFLHWHLLPEPQQRWPQLFLYMKRGIGLLFVAVVLVGVVYQFHLLHYSAEQQLADSKGVLSLYYRVPKEDVSFSIATFPVFRSYAHYTLGLLRTARRVELRSMVYFLGEVGVSGWPHYFPVLYGTKIPLALHFLSAGAVVGGILAYARRKKSSFSSLRTRAYEHFSLLAMGIFIAVYVGVALLVGINIGFRHLLPIMPFVYMLTAAGICALFRYLPRIPYSLKITATGLLLIWYMFSSLSAFPHFLSYYNEVAGGSSEGYKIATDSNYDWGQDTKRLAQWVESNGVDKIYVDTIDLEKKSLQYYLGDKFISWYGSSAWKLYGIETKAPEEFPHGNYLAVSVTFLAGNDWTGEPGQDYEWLREEDFVTRVGTSIFVYYIDK